MSSPLDPGTVKYTDVSFEALRTQAKALEDKATDLGDFYWELSQAWQPIVDAYVGPGSFELVSAMGRFSAVTTSLATDLTTVAGALKSFADEGELIVADLKTLKADAQDLWDDAARIGKETDAAGEAKSWDQDQDLVDANSGRVAKLESLELAFEDADTKCGNKIKGVSWLIDPTGNPGNPNPWTGSLQGTVLTDQEIELWGTVVAPLMLQSKGASDPGIIAMLDRFFEVYGDDPKAMDAFFSQLGGGSTVDVIDAWGRAAQAETDSDRQIELAELAARFRAGLSLGSKEWTEAAATAFALAMLSNPDRRSSASYLFARPDIAPMGEKLTLAAADEVERLELAAGMGFLYGESVPPGVILLSIEERKTENSWIRGNDLSSQILNTLGYYPDSAFQWLTDGGGKSNTERIDYWFGTRNFGSDYAGNTQSSDGYTGLMGLFNGAMRHSNGPLDGVYSSGTAEVAHDVIEAIARDKHIWMGNLSPAAEENLAHAIEAYIVPLIETSIQEPGTTGSAALLSLLSNSNTGFDFYAPNVDDRSLSHLLALATFGEEGRGRSIVAQSIDAYQYQLIELAASGNMDSSAVAHALEHAARADGVYASAVVFGQIESGRKSEFEAAAARDWLVSQARTGIGLIPGGEEVAAGLKLVGAGLGTVSSVLGYFEAGASFISGPPIYHQPAVFDLDDLRKHGFAQGDRVFPDDSTLPDVAQEKIDAWYAEIEERNPLAAAHMSAREKDAMRGAYKDGFNQTSGGIQTSGEGG